MQEDARLASIMTGRVNLGRTLFQLPTFGGMGNKYKYKHKYKQKYKYKKLVPEKIPPFNTEVRFITAVTAGGSVKFLPVV